MKKRLSRTLAILLTLCLALSLVPIPPVSAIGAVNVALDAERGGTGVMYLGADTIASDPAYTWLNTGGPMNVVASVGNKDGDYSINSIIGCRFNAAIVDAVELLIYEDASIGGEMGKPKTITVQYWDEGEQEFVNVSGQSKNSDFETHTWDSTINNFAANPPYSVITFDEVETTKIQVVVEHNENPIGLREFKVWGDYVESEEPVRSNAALASNGGKTFLKGTVSEAGHPIASANDGNIKTYWSDFNTDKCYYPNDYPYDDPVTLGARFNGEYSIEAVNIYFIHDGGGCLAPAEIEIQYWDGEAYVPVSNQSPAKGSAFTGDKNGTIGTLFTFDPVQTTRICAVMKHTVSAPYGRAIAVSEFEALTPDEIEAPEAEEFIAEIPPEAAALPGVAKPVINLSDSDGAWQFLMDPPSDSVPVPEDFSEELDPVQDFDFTAWSSEDWKDVIVPGELVMQGFDIKNNVEYYYQREIAIPADYGDNRVMIRFDGVYTNTRVWVDGQYVRTHKGGFTTWDCDITEYAAPGETVILTVGVADLYGNNPGTWNPHGDSVADPSGATYYANHNIGGILREVFLMALPKDYIARIHTNTTFTDTTFTDADLEIKAQLGMVSDEASLLLEVVDKTGETVASDTIEFTKADAWSELEETTISVRAPLKWDAEHPNLYTLRATLTVDAEVLEVTTQRFGFRQFDFGGSYGDPNKVYVNGREIQLRGTCRHDLSWDLLGRSTTKEMDYMEIQAYKDANINFIRTSHYPVSRHLLDACDELGIYVEEENAACWGPVGCPPEEYLNGFKEVIERDRNRTCILLWSLANESTWATPFRMEYDFIRETDPTRMVIFSYPNTVPASEKDVYFDIFSVHYDSWNSANLGKADMPVLHDEYCPSSVHHYYEIQRDLSSKAFYEQSIYKFWDNVLRTDGALGGAIWAANDEVFFIPEGTTKARGAQGYYEGYTTGDGEWGAIHDAFKREKPEAWLVKKGYSPVRLNEKVFYATDDSLTIPVTSGYDHTNFNELTIKYAIDGGSVKTAAPPSIAPHGKGNIIINDAALEGATKVSVDFYNTFGGAESLVDVFEFNLVGTTYTFIPASEEAPELLEDADSITVSGEDFSVAFDKTAGLISEAKFKGDTLITGGPYLSVPDADFGVRDNKWIPDAADGIKAELSGDLAVVTLKGRYARGQGVEFTVTISNNGIITTGYKLTTAPASNVLSILKSVGVSYDIPSDIKSVSWNRDTFHNVYHENNIARPVGEALKVRPEWESSPDTYGEVPTWDWYMDMKDFSLFVTDDPRDGIVTNDFKTMRENIWNYDVHFSGTTSRISVESDLSDAAQVVVSPAWELVDDRDSRIQYTGGTWTQRNNQTAGFSLNAGNTNNFAFNRTETISSASGARCELEFEGTGVSYIGPKLDDGGYLNVYIDGTLMRRIDARGGWGNSMRRVLYSVNGLEDGEHTIRLERVNGTLSVDAFGVLKGEATDPAQQNSQLVISQQWYHPDLNWGSYVGTPPTLTNGSSGSATIRLTDKDNMISDEERYEVIPVTDITGVPKAMPIGGTINLVGTVTPADATIKDIVWSVKDPGLTGATITENNLKATSGGIAVITATIESFISTIDTFSKDFYIVVLENAALASNDGVMYKTEETYTQAGRPVSTLNNGAVGLSTGYWSDWKTDYSYPNHATIGATLKEAYTVDAVELYFLSDGGGCWPPSKVTVQYWNGTSYVDVSNQSQTTGFTGNVSGSLGSFISFDPVETADIRAVIEHGTNDAGQIRSLAMTEFVVYRQYSSALKVVADKEALTWDVIKSLNTLENAVTSDLTLPTGGENGSAIEWTSSAPATISDTGTVTRPAYSAGNKVVTLTAAITNGNTSDAVVFTLTVLAKASSPLSPPSSDTGTKLPGGSTVTASGNQDPITNSNGSVTLPGGGTITTAGGSRIVVPAGTVVNANGSIALPNGKIGCTIKNKDGTTVEVGPGMTITLPDNGTPLSNANISWHNPFIDVRNTDWFYGDVQFAFTHGLINGMGTNTYSPNTHLTRGMLVTILYRDIEEPTAGSHNTPFDDVGNAYYTDPIIWAASNGIVSGYGNGNVGPNDHLTRQDLAVILMRYAEFRGLKLPAIRTFNGFADEAHMADYAKAAIKTLYEAGVINGRDVGVFDPRGNATRGEIAAMLHRFLEAVM